MNHDTFSVRRERTACSDGHEPPAFHGYVETAVHGQRND